MTPTTSSDKRVAKIDFTGNVKDLHDSQQTNSSISTEDVQNSSDSSVAKADVESQMTTATLEEPTLTVVTDLSVYVGETLEAQVDSFISAHPVVMFTKSWCLFSIDAQNFLLHDMKVSLHVIEVDSHTQGKDILNYVQEQTKHRTVPVIFIKGDFLGGFEDVNQLYAQGSLQEQYLHDLTQADRCEEFMQKSDLSSKPLFWFPETVNAHVVRFTGAFNSLLSLLSAATVFYYPWGAYVAYGLFFDFILRFFGGAKASVLGNIATCLSMAMEPKPRHGRPKQFATVCGIMCSGPGSLCFLLASLLNVDVLLYVGIGFMGALAVATGMEGFLDYCVGCVMFKYGIILGIIPK